jgi:hypothetical protein
MIILDGKTFGKEVGLVLSLPLFCLEKDRRRAEACDVKPAKLAFGSNKSGSPSQASALLL